MTFSNGVKMTKKEARQREKAGLYVGEHVCQCGSNVDWHKDHHKTCHRMGILYARNATGIR